MTISDQTVRISLLLVYLNNPVWYFDTYLRLRNLAQLFKTYHSCELTLRLNLYLEIWQIHWYLCWKKCEKLLHCKSYSQFCSKNINAFQNTSATPFNEFVINEIVKLTMLKTTGPWLLWYSSACNMCDFLSGMFTFPFDIFSSQCFMNIVLSVISCIILALTFSCYE